MLRLPSKREFNWQRDVVSISFHVAYGHAHKQKIRVVNLF